MFEIAEEKIVQVLEEFRATGPGSHVHLDELFGVEAPPVGDPVWVNIARRVAEVAGREPGRYIVSVPLASQQDCRGRRSCPTSSRSTVTSPRRSTTCWIRTLGER